MQVSLLDILPQWLPTIGYFKGRSAKLTETGDIFLRGNLAEESFYGAYDHLQNY